MTHIITIDQGTTSSRAIIFDATGQQIASAQYEFKQFFPNDGWVEHCPNEILATCLAAVRECLRRASLTTKEITSIGITNQRETVVVWDRFTGEPIYPAIVWQDRRTADLCNALRQKNAETLVKQKTGLLLDPYFSATKIAWILDHVDGARQRAKSGELLAGTIDSWLIWQLTNRRHHRTDATNASRTLLFNIHSNQWDVELCSLMHVPIDLLPEVCDSAFDFGDACIDVFQENPVPITGVAGDQQAALVGQCAFQPGAIKSTYGTGCFVIANTGTEPLNSDHRLLTTIAYRLNGKTYYAIEGSIFIAGAAVQWLRDELCLIKNASETEAILEATPIDHGVLLVPAFTGLGAPHWNADARGALFGLKRNSGKHEIVSATLQSIALQTDDLLNAMRDDGIKVTEFKVDGGMVQNSAFCQLLADFIDQPVYRPNITETTALGAAFLSALGSGVYENLEEVAQHWQLDRCFAPTKKTHIATIKQQWQRCIQAVLDL